MSFNFIFLRYRFWPPRKESHWLLFTFWVWKQSVSVLYAGLDPSSWFWELLLVNINLTILTAYYPGFDRLDVLYHFQPKRFSSVALNVLSLEMISIWGECCCWPFLFIQRIAMKEQPTTNFTMDCEEHGRETITALSQN
jgi:hypothetical protein